MLHLGDKLTVCDVNLNSPFLDKYNNLVLCDWLYSERQVPNKFPVTNWGTNH